MSHATDASSASAAPAGAPAAPKAEKRRGGKARVGASLLARGEPMVWLTGGALALSLFMILGLLGKVTWDSLRAFWLTPTVKVQLLDGSTYMGEVRRDDLFKPTATFLDSLSDEARAAADAEMAAHDGWLHRILLRTANFEFYGGHFTWVNDCEIAERTEPEWGTEIHRFEAREFFGFPTAFAVIDHPIDDTGKSLDETKAEAREAAAKIQAGPGERVVVSVRKFVDGRTRFDFDAPDAIDDATRVFGVGRIVAETPDAVTEKVREYHAEALARRSEIRSLEVEIGDINRHINHARMNASAVGLKYGNGSPEHVQAVADSDELRKGYVAEQEDLKKEIAALRGENQQLKIAMTTVDGHPFVTHMGDISRFVHANRMGVGEKVGFYFSRWWEFLTADPREANMAGGIFPQIIGTVLMVFIMCLLVVPFGVLAALYIREYAKAGLVISIVRIAINNLAGVPSIVFGVFGLGFFIYIVGGWIDGGPDNAGMPLLPRAQWFALLAAFAVMVPAGGFAAYLNRRTFIDQKDSKKLIPNALCGLVILGTLGGLLVGYGMLWTQIDNGVQAFLLVLLAAAVLAFGGAILHAAFSDPNDRRPAHERLLYSGGIVTTIVAAIAGVVLIAVTPFFEGFFPAYVAQGEPRFGKGGLIWASFTLALLTLPVVIVATEEALSAVPNSMREGSYACGASKWQTIKRIVLPRALPGIMTGTILAMARGAGEVAPLMLVGVVKFTQELPISPLPSEQFGVHRSFLHLGFHIYDLGFQSQDSEGALPLVYTTTMLLILIVAILNVSAIYLRSRLKKRFMASAF